MTTHNDQHVFKAGVRFEGAVTYGTDAVANDPPLKYVSQEILSADMTSGTTKTIALTGFPANITPEYCYVHTAAEVASSSMANTTGATVEVGTGGDPDALMGSISIFGAAAPVTGARGVELGKLATLTVNLKITATGPGTPNVTHLTGLQIKVVVGYRQVSATYPV